MIARPTTWPHALARLLLPNACALCGAGCRDALCPPCQRDHVDAQPARCRRCANPMQTGSARWHCGACQAQRPAYDATIAAASYGSPLDQLILQLKFGGVLALAPWCAGALGRSVARQDGFVLPNLLCPVPLGAARLRERGFNQALEIARPLSRQLGVPLRARLAIRARETPAQSSLTPADLRNAFIIAPQYLALVRGQHIGLVDDVMTSGHTLDELARLFKRHGAARVSNLVFARTPPHNH